MATIMQYVPIPHVKLSLLTCCTYCHDVCILTKFNVFSCRKIKDIESEVCLPPCPHTPHTCAHTSTHFTGCKQHAQLLYKVFELQMLSTLSLCFTLHIHTVYNAMPAVHTDLFKFAWHRTTLACQTHERHCPWLCSFGAHHRMLSLQMAKTQINKATSVHLGMLKVRPSGWQGCCHNPHVNADAVVPTVRIASWTG